MKEKFSPGRIVATKGVADRAKEDKAFEEFCEMSLRRHLNGGFGEWGRQLVFSLHFPQNGRNDLDYNRRG